MKNERISSNLYVLRCIFIFILGMVILALAGCKKEYNEIEEEHVHTKVHVLGKEATCISEGRKEYWYCSKCNKVFKDRETTQEIALEETILPKTEHSIVEDLEILPTCQDTGLTAGSHCSYCNEVFEEQEEIPSLGHNFDKENVAWVWNDFSEAELVLSCKHDATHKRKYLAAISSKIIEPTCTDSGKITYTASISLEEKLYTNQKEDILLPTDHNFDVDHIVWVWEGDMLASAQITCKNDAKHTLKYEANIKQETIEATCMTQGKKISIATISIQGKKYSDKKEEILPALGHNFDLENISWIWDGYETAVARVTCQFDTNHIEEMEAKIIKELLPASCLTDGEIKYIASIELQGKQYQNEQKKVVLAFGHAFDYENAIWNWDGNTSAELSFFCSHDSSHKDMYIAEITKSELPSTCVTQGKIIYTAKVLANQREYVEEKYEELPIDSNQHEYDLEAMIWIWKPMVQGYEVFANLYCKCGKDAKEFKEIHLKEEKVPATFLEEGYIKYEATIQMGERIYYDQKLDILPKKEYVSSINELQEFMHKDRYDITLKKDIVLEEPLILKGEFASIDLNGYCLTCSSAPVSVLATHAVLLNGYITVDIAKSLEPYILQVENGANLLIQNIKTLGGVSVQSSKVVLERTIVTTTNSYALHILENSFIEMRHSKCYKNQRDAAFFYLEKASKEIFNIEASELYSTCNAIIFDKLDSLPEEMEALSCQTLEVLEYMTLDLEFKSLTLYEALECTNELSIHGKILYLDLNTYTLSVSYTLLKVCTSTAKIYNGEIHSLSSELVEEQKTILKIEKGCIAILDTLILYGNLQTEEAFVSLWNVFIQL